MILSVGRPNIKLCEVYDRKEAIREACLYLQYNNLTREAITIEPSVEKEQNGSPVKYKRIVFSSLYPYGYVNVISFYLYEIGTPEYQTPEEFRKFIIRQKHVWDMDMLLQDAQYAENYLKHKGDNK